MCVLLWTEIPRDMLRCLITLEGEVEGDFRQSKTFGLNTTLQKENLIKYIFKKYTPLTSNTAES